MSAWRRTLVGALMLALLGGLNGLVLAQDDDEGGASPAPPGAEAAFGTDIAYAPLPSLDPSLVPDADGFVFEEVTAGVRRLVTDGAGHFPSATYIREARDMDQLAVDQDGRVLVWSTTHGIDNELGGDAQLWVLGEEGVIAPGQGPPRPRDESTQVAPDGSTWLLGWESGGGIIRTDGETAERFLAGRFPGSLAFTPDGRVWLAAGHGPDEPGGIYVIEPGAKGEPVDAAVMAMAPPAVVMGGPTPVWERVLDLEGRAFGSLLAADSGLWAIGGDPNQPGTLWHSTDGAAWTQLDTSALFGEGAVVNQIAEIGPGLLAVGSVPSGDVREAVAWTSADGQEWTVSPLGYTIPEPKRPFEVTDLVIRALAAGPRGTVIAAAPGVGIDFGLLEPNVAAALPTGLGEFASGNSLTVDPWRISVSVGPFEVFSAAVPDLDVDQELFAAYARAVDRGMEDLVLFVTDDYATWQRVDEWAGADDPLGTMTATRDGFLASTWTWGSSPTLYASTDGLTWERTELPADRGMVRWFETQGGRLLMAGDLDGSSIVWASEDDGETWTAWAGLPRDAWDVRAGAFGLLATGEHPSEWWDHPGSTTVIDHAGLIMSIEDGPGGLTVTGPDGETLLTASLSGAGDGPDGLSLPPFITADHDRGSFTVIDPESGDPLMTISYREMQDAYELARKSGGSGPDMFVAYSADGRAWSEQRVMELAGVPGWIDSVAVGDDFAVMLVSEPDGPSSLWRATIG